MDPRFETRRFLRLCRWPEGQRDAHGLAYRGPTDFVLREGRWWNVEPGLPPGVPMRGAPRACYGNSIYVATVHGLRYVQGYALHQIAGAVSHAWVADGAGRAWDVTWPTPGLAYLGVELAVERADDATWFGDADPIDDFNRRWPLLRERWTGSDPYDRSRPPSPAMRAALLARDGELDAARAAIRQADEVG